MLAKPTSSPFFVPAATQDAGADRKMVLEETLRWRIVNMDLLPGAVVDEVALAREFELSRPPVRELMRQLAAEGYLELEANRPARVSPMDYESMRCLFQSAPLIYAATTQLAASRATADDIKRLKSIQENFRRAMEENNTPARVFYNKQFHNEIGSIAGDPYLLPSLRRISIDHARLAKTFFRSNKKDAVPEDMQQDMQVVIVQHDQMIEAIACHDEDMARQLVQEHWSLSRKRIAEYVMPGGLEISLH